MTCSACNSGYFLGAGSTSCISCSDGNNGGLVGCATCSAALPFSCSTCLSGYFNSGSTCIGCTPDLKGLNEYFCHYMISIFINALFLKSGTGCSSCGSTTTCSTCLTNTFTTAGTCNLCDVSCATCTDNGYKNCSTSCSSTKYYLDNTTECYKCKVAMPGCKYCSSKTTCT